MGIQDRAFLKNKNSDFDNILDSVVTSADHFVSTGTVPTIAAAGGSAACTIGATSTDTAGVVTIGTQLANTNTCTLTFAKAYAAAPVCTVSAINQEAWVNVGHVVSATAITWTATGNTGTNTLSYHCVALDAE